MLVGYPSTLGRKRWALLALVTAALLAACAQAAPATPTPTLSATQQPTATPRPTATPPPPAISHGLYPDYTLGFNIGAGAWLLENTQGKVVAEWVGDEWLYHFDMLAQDERISVFDGNTFPEAYKDVAANWLEYTETRSNAEIDAQWSQYQEFVEAARAEFFENQGITNEVEGLDSINKNLKSLWGMIYWIQQNRLQVIEQQMMPVVTPKEIRIILEYDSRPIVDQGNQYSQYYYDRAVLPDGTELWRAYGYNFFAYKPKDPWYNSVQVGNILGRNNIQIDHLPVDSVTGDLALIAAPFGGNSQSLLVLTHLKSPPESSQPYRHILFAQMATFDEAYTITKGTVCSGYDFSINNSGRRIQLPVDYAIRPLYSIRNGKKVTLTDLFDQLGWQITFQSPVPRESGPRVVDQIMPSHCLDSKLGMEVAGLVDFLRNRDLGVYPYAWPWQQEPAIHQWEFTRFSTEGWQPDSGFRDLNMEGYGVMSIEVASGNARLTSPELSINAEEFSKLLIRMRVSAGTTGRVYFATGIEPEVSEVRSASFTVLPDGIMHTYTIDFSNNPAWQGTIKQLRIVPAYVKAFLEIDYIRLVGPYDFEFEEIERSEGWMPFSNISGLRTSTFPQGGNRGLSFQSTGSDPAIVSPVFSMEAQRFPTIQFSMMVSCGTTGQLFFATDQNPSFDEERSISFPIENWRGFRTYTLDMSAIDSWNGTITQIRLDPMQCRGAGEIDFIRFIAPSE